VIAIPTDPLWHYAGDAAAWMAAAIGGRWVYRRRRPAVEALAARTTPGYFLSLALGAVAGAWLFGSLNRRAPSHSIAGALAGAIAGVELWKWRHGVRGSTGGPFVVPLCLGIIVGRWGCLFAGVPDATFGIPTGLPWGVDLGDGIARHPVQAYESLAMLLFLLAYLAALRRVRPWAVQHGFHAFVLVYAGQRFVWEFLKPYPSLVFSLNLFHLLMIGLAIYALVWIAADRRD
jgi:prolipoprotein diacylglyceryltransferase